MKRFIVHHYPSTFLQSAVHAVNGQRRCPKRTYPKNHERR
jgi:hypothetical protein